MSNIDQMTSTSDLLEITSANQDLFTNLNAEDAETISGGAEVFTIRNNTLYNITYTVDGKSWTHRPNESWTWTAYNGGIIGFDRDVRSNVRDYKSYNLADGKIYAFQNNNNTLGNPYDIDLYAKAV